MPYSSSVPRSPLMLAFLTLLVLPQLSLQNEPNPCAQGSTFESRCIALPRPTAYVDDQCIVAVEDSRASTTQLDNVCSGLGQMSGIQGSPFRLSVTKSKEQIRKMESFLALKQTGFYYAAGGEKVVPSSGNGNTVLGYLCSFPDNCVCEEDWYRFRSQCYKPMRVNMTHAYAASLCDDNDGSLTKIEDDEQNKFVAMLARRELFGDSIGQNPIWGSLSFVDGEWSHRDAKSNQKVTYMRWWSNEDGTHPATKKPSEFDASTIFTGKNDQDRVASFGYWGTEKSTEKLMFVCQRPLEPL